MSTLKVTNIQATGETATRAVSGVAAAWVNFNGKGVAPLNDSTNISSLTDNGTGDYSFSFISNVTYPYSFQGSNGDHTSTITTVRVLALGAETEVPTSSGFRVFSLTSAVQIFDNDYGFITIHGDLA